MSPGEIADRLAILEIKMKRLPGQRRSIMKQLREAQKEWRWDLPQINELRRLNAEQWECVERVYKDFKDKTYCTQDWRIATPEDIKRAQESLRNHRRCHELNVARVAVKNEINRIVGAPTEEKSWKPSTN